MHTLTCLAFNFINLQLFQIVWIAQVIHIKTTISWHYVFCVFVVFFSPKTKLSSFCSFCCRFVTKNKELAVWCISNELFVLWFLLREFQTIFSVFALTFKINYFVNTIIWFNGAQYFGHLILVSYYMYDCFFLFYWVGFFLYVHILFVVLIFWIAVIFLIFLVLPLVPLLSLLSPSVVLLIWLNWY